METLGIAEEEVVNGSRIQDGTHELAARPGGRPAVEPLVRTRIRPPALVGGYRERDRVSARLDAALDDATRLTLLSAPPGYGKTVAVRGWLASRGLPVAWLSFDAADADPARFARYLGAALDGVRPGLAGTAAELFGPGAAPTPELVGATFVDAISASDDPFVLVLDDLQAVAAEPVHAVLRFLVEHGPPFAHLVLLTREDPPLPLARLRAHGRLVELRAADLRCTPDEAATYLADALSGSAGPPGIHLDAASVETLVERTEGWIAGLQLAAISLRERPDPGAAIAAFGASQRFVLDYLADEVLARVDADLRSFLVRVSVADRFTAGLCGALTGRDDAAALLDRAERANLFVIPLDFERRWYRFHGLFGDHLRGRLPEAERRELHARAAAWLEDGGYPREAMAHALAAGSVERAAALVAREARAAFEAGEIATLLGWLAALPPELVAADGELASFGAWALFESGRLAEAVRCAAERLASCTARGPAEGRLLALRALLGTVTEPDAERTAEEALALLGPDPFFRALALQAASLARLANDDVPAALEAARAAFDAAVESGHPMAILPATNPLVHALVAIGRRDEAEALCARVLAEHADARGHVPPIAWSVRNVHGIALYEGGHVEEARRELEAGLAAAAGMGIGRPMLGWALPYLALARAACGETDAALEALSVSRDELRTTGMALPGIAGETAARILLAGGDVPGAAAWADSGALEVPAGSPLLALLRRSADTTVARVRIAQRRFAEAGRLLAAVEAGAGPRSGSADRVSVLLLRAGVAEGLGGRAEARVLLAEAVRLASPGGYVQRFVDDGTPVAHLLPLVRGLDPAFVDGVLAALSRQATTAGGRPAAARPARRARGTGVWQAPGGGIVELLTPRERDVLRLMGRGATNAEVAEELSVSVGTAKWHVGNVIAKLGATNRTAALVRAQELGLV